MLKLLAAASACGLLFAAAPAAAGESCAYGKIASLTWSGFRPETGPEAEVSNKPTIQVEIGSSTFVIGMKTADDRQRMALAEMRAHLTAAMLAGMNVRVSAMNGCRASGGWVEETAVDILAP
ncbi:MAG: hypothetical protein H2041_14175 [Phenylobacterium sp.]|uniref:hypothetical protein n=1 Tax=Phenylobacterium sp. TaxID=1871053 RepID=UPI00185049CD|nr:hypothetical protein [Phenylobacterium sp.]MBA4794803.1 hypothetical protein [Phenylobacterium sp.]